MSEGPSSSSRPGGRSRCVPSRARASSFPSSRATSWSRRSAGPTRRRSSSTTSSACRASTSTASSRSRSPGVCVEHATRPDVRGVVVPHGTDTMEESVYLVDRLLAVRYPGRLHRCAARRRPAGRRRPAQPPRRDSACGVRQDARGSAPSSSSRARSMRPARPVRFTRALCVPSTLPATVRSATSTATSSTLRRSPSRTRRCPRRNGSRRSICTVSTPAATAASSATRSRPEPKAIVLEGTGRGNANEQVVEAVREATAHGVPVVVCSRCATGRVEPVYGRGGGRDLEEAGALFAGDLAGPKVRVLLQIALGAGLDVAGDTRRRGSCVGPGRTGAQAASLRLVLGRLRHCQRRRRRGSDHRSPRSTSRSFPGRRRTRRSPSIPATTRFCWPARTAFSKARSASTARPTVARPGARRRSRRRSPTSTSTCPSDPGVAIDRAGRQYFSFDRSTPCTSDAPSRVYVAHAHGPGGGMVAAGARRTTRHAHASTTSRRSRSTRLR